MAETIAPPFSDPDQAARKVQIAEDLWNTRDPERVAAAYTEDCQWRNRAEFLSGPRRHHCLPSPQMGSRTRLQTPQRALGLPQQPYGSEFFYEWHDDSGQWYRSYGNELWEFAPSGLMQRREASINDLPIRPEDRTL